MLPLKSQKINKLNGKCIVAGDKSISHRSLMLGSLALGTTTITGLLEGEDVLATAKAMKALGAKIEKKDNIYHVEGCGFAGLSESSEVLDMGNAGTGCRLLMGLVSTLPMTSFFTGDASLRKRPMKRVIDPLSLSGAKFISRSGGLLPLAVIGAKEPLPIEYVSPVASAQVKSAILLAGLNINGITSVIEKERTRDHSERMLRFFGADVREEECEQGYKISITGKPKITPQNREIRVAGDISSAAFLLVAAIITPDSEIMIENVGYNPLRTGIIDSLLEMGADIEIINPREIAGEPVVDLIARSSKLKGAKIPAHRAPSMIDEYPILAVAAAYAEGESIFYGLSELRVKESNRLDAVANGLKAAGVSCEINGDDLLIRGGKVAGDCDIVTHMDHRIAMSFLVMGMNSEGEIRIDDGAFIATSFPNFVQLMNGMGAKIISNLKIGSSKAGHIKHRPLKIAIDGPAASGKGTLARRIADYFGYAYLDTGSLYRAVGMKLIYADKDPHNEADAIEAALAVDIDDLSNPRIRQERIGKAASIISAMPKVREILLDFQRSIANKAEGAVLDGRDIGTVVCPDADLKIFITASIEARAQRRYRQLSGEGVEVVYESVFDDLRERDERDSKRSIAPMVAAADAVVIDTTDLGAEEVFQKIMEMILPVAMAA